MKGYLEAETRRSKGFETFLSHSRAASDSLLETFDLLRPLELTLSWRDYPTKFLWFHEESSELVKVKRRLCGLKVKHQWSFDVKDVNIKFEKNIWNNELKIKRNFPSAWLTKKYNLPIIVYIQFNIIIWVIFVKIVNKIINTRL